MLLIICMLISLHLTSAKGISISQSFLLKSVMPVSMLQTMTDLLHYTMLVGKFGTAMFICYMGIDNFSYWGEGLVLPCQIFLITPTH